MCEKEGRLQSHSEWCLIILVATPRRESTQREIVWCETADDINNCSCSRVDSEDFGKPLHIQIEPMCW